jgi:hypothetical protein
MPPPVKGVGRVVTRHPTLTICPHRPLVMRKSNPRNRPAADSPLQLPPSTTGGAERMKTSSSVCEVAGPAKCQQDQQFMWRFKNLGESTRRIKLNDEYGTCQYIKQWGQLSVTLHQTVALEHRAIGYQNSRTYKELEDDQKTPQ